MDLQEATMNLINSESNKSLKESIDWNYYKKFHVINDKYLPDMDEGDTMKNGIKI